MGNPDGKRVLAILANAVPVSAAHVFPAYLATGSVLLIAALLSGSQGPFMRLLRAFYAHINPPGSFPVPALIKIGNNLLTVAMIAYAIGSSDDAPPLFCALCLGPFALTTYAYLQLAGGLHYAFLLRLIILGLMVWAVGTNGTLIQTVAEALYQAVNVNPLAHAVVGLLHLQMFRDLLLALAIGWPQTVFSRFLMPGMSGGSSSPHTINMAGMLSTTVAFRLPVLKQSLPLGKAGAEEAMRSFCWITLLPEALMFLGALQQNDFGTLVYVSLPFFMKLYALFLHGFNSVYDFFFTTLCLLILFYHAVLKNILFPKQKSQEKSDTKKK